MYTITSAVHSANLSVAVVGCGGTGGFLAEGLCRLFVDQPHVQIALVDHDRVEERNLGRQNFYSEDLGRFKSQALAQRLARKYNRPIQYSIYPFSSPLSENWGGRMIAMRPGVVIGCVDNALAREALTDYFKNRTMSWWIDAGNGESYGQVLVGNATVNALRYVFRERGEQCIALPLPTIQRPELLIPPAAPALDDPNCAVAVAAGDQSPTVNHFMASVVLEVLRRLLEGTLSWMQVTVDLNAGLMRPMYATPENVSRITGLPLRMLVDRMPPPPPPKPLMEVYAPRDEEAVAQTEE